MMRVGVCDGQYARFRESIASAGKMTLADTCDAHHEKQMSRLRHFVILLPVLALASCSAPCKIVYGYDGGATARPYFRVEHCPGGKPRVTCDSANRLPNPECGADDRR